MDLEAEFEDLHRHDIALVVAGTEQYQAVNDRLLDYMVNQQGLPGIYVTMNKPYTTIHRVLEDRGIPAHDIFFIDAISKTTHADTPDSDDVIFLETPEHLTDVSIAIDSAIEELSDDRKFLFLDSLATLSVYNEMEDVVRFVHQLTAQMRDWDVAGVIFSLEAESDRELIDKISQFCDRVIGHPNDPVSIDR